MCRTSLASLTLLPCLQTPQGGAAKEAGVLPGSRVASVGGAAVSARPELVRLIGEMAKRPAIRYDSLEFRSMLSSMAV